MLKNYIQIVFRNLLKNKLFTFINVFGLAMGITCCLIIAFYILGETNYDSFHNNKDRIYRVGLNITNAKGTSKAGVSYIPLAEALETRFPEIEKTAKIFLNDKILIKGNDKIFFENKTAFADSTFFTIFSFELLKGDPEKVLTLPDNVVISESIAEKYFGKDDPIGKIIRYDNYKNFTVAGIFKDVPENSHLQFDFVFPYKNLHDKKIYSYKLNWGLITSSYTYALLKPNVSIEDLEEKSKNIIHEYRDITPPTQITPMYQKLEDIFLQSDVETPDITTNSITRLFIVALIGLFILSIATINYINLSTAKSSQRTKEVGIRKVLGAVKKQLILQFLSESIVITFLATLLSFALVEVFNPLFSTLFMKNIAISYFSDIWIPVSIFVFIILLGITAGFYPAFYLSRFIPVKILGGKSGSNKSRTNILRKVFVVFQFAICILLITGMIVIKEQHNFMLNSNLGFKNDHNIVVTLHDATKVEKHQLIKDRLSKLENVNKVTACLAPVINNRLSTSFYVKAQSDFQTEINCIDFDYLNHFNLKLIAGRFLSRDFNDDKNRSFVVTKSVATKIGFASAEEALGKEYLVGFNNIKGKIVGVVEDFHHSSLRVPKAPVVMFYYPYFFRKFVLSVESKNIPGTLQEVEKIWKEMVPGYPFEYNFLDKRINNFYKKEAQTAETISVFALIAIFLGCLGLFGLSIFSVEQKVKEIGIRKVVGASVTSIVMMLSKEFIKLILIANIIAWPLAYYLMNNWLQNFAFRIDINLLTFIFAAGISLLVGLITISYQSVKAAYINPVESLKYE
ncbi:MAG: ABC transporter permease [Rhodothermaceae bacterium]